jgi:hypothetical protein
MRRAWSIGLGAGTQVFTHLPRVLTLTVAEWIIAKQNGAPNPRPTRRPFLNAS